MKGAILGATSLVALSVMTFNAPSDAASSTLSFGGHSWTVKSSAGKTGPGPNYFSAANATVDSSGNLHMRITKSKGKWSSSEIINTASLGYGTYRWTVVNDLATLDRNVVLGLFTWNDLPDYATRELDIEIARWGSATDSANGLPVEIVLSNFDYCTPAGVCQ